MTSLADVQRPIAESATALRGWPVDQVLFTSWVVYGHSLDSLDDGSPRAARRQYHPLRERGRHSLDRQASSLP